MPYPTFTQILLDLLFLAEVLTCESGSTPFPFYVLYCSWPNLLVVVQHPHYFVLLQFCFVFLGAQVLVLSLLHFLLHLDSELNLGIIYLNFFRLDYFILGL